MKSTIGIIRIVVAVGSVIIYFKKRKVYVDDKSFKLRVLPKKTINIYQKDVLNIVGIISSSVFVVSMGEKIYLFIKEHDIALIIGKKDLSGADMIDVEPVSSEPIEVLSLAEAESVKPKQRFHTRDIIWASESII
jgi:hypothetical protein